MNKYITESEIKREWENTKRKYPDTHAGFKNYVAFKEVYLKNAKKSGYSLSTMEKRVLGKHC